MANKTEKKASEKKKSVHNGHRLRVKERFLKEGLEHFEPHQVLEMLLFFGIPMKDTNEIAHRLLDTFGSIYKVMEASYEDIRKVPGMTDNAAILLPFACQLSKRYWMDRCEMGVVISSSKDIGDYMKYRFIGEKVESVYLISMDNRAKVLNCTCVTKGDVNYADINVRKILQLALQDNATQVAVVHNHPNGHALPSQADIAVTDQLSRGLYLAEVLLLDHIIISEDDFISLADTEHYHSLFTAQYITEEIRRKRLERFSKT